MLVDGTPYRTVWIEENGATVGIIDQRKLPFAFETVSLKSTGDACYAIREMLVRGAGCIGAVAAHGMYLAAQECLNATESPERFDSLLAEKGAQLCQTRPTAMNLAWAVKRALAEVGREVSTQAKVARAGKVALEVADEDAEWCRAIGKHGLSLIESIYSKKSKKHPVNILTHCNAGWLAFVDYGSATAPIYAAHAAGIPVHVWVDETRPRNQGARLTAWELARHGVPHTVIVDNVGGHLMQHGKVDLCITGTDRTTYTGDVANKIGTYLKALAAKDNNVPFYVALPSSTFDWESRDGVREIPIEERDGTEVAWIGGEYEGGEREVKLVAGDSPVANYAFDVTPARLVTGLITERGLCEANETEIRRLFPEKFSES
jgi:methylthioribose-1-phosphate isomerase